MHSLVQRAMRGQRAALLSLLVAAGPVWAAPSLGASEQALMQGRVDDAVKGLHTALESDPHNAAAHLLLCRAYLSEEFIDQALSECQAADAVRPNDSETEDWLGRAYGMKADHSGPFTAYSLAKKVRDAFEASVRLDPRNGDAFDDLGEYYVEAPSMVGGGLDKASALADQGSAALPLHAQTLRATIAEKRKDYGTAEREFRAVAQESGRADSWIDLGRYYGRRRQNDQARAAIQHGIELVKDHGDALAHAADALIRLKLDPQMAIDALRAYLSGSELTESAPACKAHTQLGRLLLAAGDRAGAKMEFQKALALASGYAPARKELASL